MYYAVSFEGRCMGFCLSKEKAQDLVDVFGPGSQYEEQEGMFPLDVERSAKAYEISLRARGQVVTLRAVESEETTLELSEDELATLKDALFSEAPAQLDTAGDSWDETTQIRSVASQSGFFVPVAQVG